MVERVVATAAAKEWIGRLSDKHGPMMFHQSGGCCDGSAPMCYPRDEFKTGDSDMLPGALGGAPFCMGAAQFEYWRHTQLGIDIVPGRGAGFSLESPEGIRRLNRSRIFTDDEIDDPEAQV